MKRASLGSASPGVGSAFVVSTPGGGDDAAEKRWVRAAARSWADVAVGARVAARGVLGLGDRTGALGADLEAQLLQAVFLVTHVMDLLLSSCSGERMEFRYHSPCG